MDYMMGKVELPDRLRGISQPGDSPSRQPEIEGLIQTLVDSTQQLAMAMAELEKRLALVLRSSSPEGQTAPEKASRRTGLGNILDATVEQIQTTNRRVDDVLSRLEV